MSQFTKVQNASLAQEMGKLDRRLRDDLRSELLDTGNGRYADLVGAVHDQGDESVADMLSDLNNALVERHVRELREIESARRRLAAGSINVCRDCGGGIGHKRLMAYPVAVRCIGCQEHYDRTYKHEITPRL